MKHTRQQSSLDPSYRRQGAPSSYTAGGETIRHTTARGKNDGYASTPPVHARTFPIVVSASIKILGSDTNRRGVFIQNIGVDNVYITYDSEAQIIGSTYAGHLLAPGFSYEAPAGWAPINDIWLVAESGSTGTLVVVTESVII